VDDAADVRALVNARLRLSRRFSVVGEGSTGLDAIALAEQHHPDLMLLDVSMPRMDGLEALPKVLAASPTTRVVLFSGLDERALAARGRHLGAAASIEKSMPLHRLADELAAVLATTPSPVGGDRRRRRPAPLRGEPTADMLPHGEPAAGTVPREQIEGYGDVFDLVAVGMATLTLTGRVVRVNAALTRLLERPAETLVGARYADLPPDGGAVIARAVDDLAQNQAEVANVEHPLLAASGTKRVAVTLATVRSDEGRPLYLSLQAHDVTVQRAAEADLHRSEERFRLLVDAVQDYAIYMIDPQGLVASWNAGAQRIKGYTAEEVVGQHFRCFYPLESRRLGLPEHGLEVALRDGRYAEEGLRVRKDGQRFRASVTITPVHNSEGTLLGFAKVTRDVTERHGALESLRQSEKRFQLLVDAVEGFAIFMIDPQGRVASWNAGAERIKGYPAAEIVGQHYRCLFPPEVRQQGLPEQHLELALRDGRFTEEGWRVRKDGETFWARVVITAVHDADGRHVGFAKVTRDLTERRTAARDRRRAPWPLPDRSGPDQAAAGALAGPVDASTDPHRRRSASDAARFVAVAAHELHGPVSALGGAADLLAAHWQELAAAERADLFAGMVTSAGRLNRLLADLVTAARLEAGAVPLDIGTVSVAELLEDVAFAARRDHPGAGVEVVVSPDLKVWADREHLVQALDHLVSNALRHGAPPVRLSATAEQGGVVIRVADAGAGVPVPLRPRLFERFASGDDGGGRGLGLFLVRELARLQGGDAWYEDPLGEEARPTFALAAPRA
jgi:PAS domain S-box-containing protein